MEPALSQMEYLEPVAVVPPKRPRTSFNWALCIFCQAQKKHSLTKGGINGIGKVQEAFKQRLNSQNRQD